MDQQIFRYRQSFSHLPWPTCTIKKRIGLKLVELLLKIDENQYGKSFYPFIGIFGVVGVVSSKCVVQNSQFMAAIRDGIAIANHEGVFEISPELLTCLRSAQI